MMADIEPAIYDEDEDSVSIQVGRMEIYVFNSVDGTLRYHGAVNAPEQRLSEVPDAVVSKAEEYVGLDVDGITEEQQRRLDNSPDERGDL